MAQAEWIRADAEKMSDRFDQLNAAHLAAVYGGLVWVVGRVWNSADPAPALAAVRARADVALAVVAYYVLSAIISTKQRSIRARWIALQIQVAAVVQLLGGLPPTHWLFAVENDAYVKRTEQFSTVAIGTLGWIVIGVSV
jgi:hypothetical protein